LLGASNEVVIRSDVLAHSLFQCLAYMHWAGGQLQQLVLPGDPAKAAAALQDLQEQQQQLQQVVATAVWRLNRVAALFAEQNTELALQRQQQLTGSSSSIDGSGSIMSTGQLRLTAAELAAVVSSKPVGLLPFAELDPAGWPVMLMLPTATEVDLTGRQLPSQLYAFGSALWSALPQPRCCNNVACTNLGSVSEAKLVAGKASRCSECKTAKQAKGTLLP
jgi:hypothetical protein